MNNFAKERRPVVGIGASAGGIEAFRGFFENMPSDSGLCFVVVLHLPVDRKSILPEILSRWTTMRIVEAMDGCLVEPNCVYVPPPGVVITYHDGHLHLHPLEAGEPREFNPITMLFNSLASALHDDAIGIVLSGTGNDGALGLKAIKEEGGLTLVQGSDGNGPQHDGMPASAIATGAVDIIAPVEALPGHIIAIQETRQGDGLASLSAEQITAARLIICAVLNRHLGHDFSGYKDKTFLRRVQRRMQVLGLHSLDAFIERDVYKRQSMKSIRECKASIRLDLDSLMWTRGAEFPVSMLAERLKCPRCGSRRVALLFGLPGEPTAKRVLLLPRFGSVARFSS